MLRVAGKYAAAGWPAAGDNVKLSHVRTGFAISKRGGLGSS